MGFFADTGDTARRFSDRIRDFQNLYRKYGLEFGRPKDVWRFTSLLTSNASFRGELVSLSNSMIRREGWKTSSTILFTIIAISIGGIGIAGMGSAFGLPAWALVTILGAFGFGIGQEIDVVMAPSDEPRTGQRFQNEDIQENSEHPTNTSTVEGTPTLLSPSLDPHVALVVQILSSLDEALTPISASVSDNNKLLEKLAVRLDNDHSVAEDTRTISVELRDRLFPELDRIARTIEAREALYREASIEQTKALRRLGTIVLSALIVFTVGFLFLAYIVVRRAHLFQ